MTARWLIYPSNNQWTFPKTVRMFGCEMPLYNPKPCCNIGKCPMKLIIFKHFKYQKTQNHFNHLNKNKKFELFRGQFSTANSIIHKAYVTGWPSHTSNWDHLILLRKMPTIQPNQLPVISCPNTLVLLWQDYRIHLSEAAGVSQNLVYRWGTLLYVLACQFTFHGQTITPYVWTNGV